MLLLLGDISMFKKRSSKKNQPIKEDHIILAALGVMNDEFNSPVPIDEINFCLRVDFNHKIKDFQLLSILNHSINSNLIEKSPKGYALTSDGEKIADSVLERL